MPHLTARPKTIFADEATDEALAATVKAAKAGLASRPVTSEGLATCLLAHALATTLGDAANAATPMSDEQANGLALTVAKTVHTEKRPSCHP